MILYILYFLKLLASSLILTIIIEEIVGIACGIRKKMDLLLIVCVNIITNPAVVSLFYMIYSFTFINKFIIQLPLEIAAVVVEGVIYKKYGEEFKKPMEFAIKANVISYLMGFVMPYIERCVIYMLRFVMAVIHIYIGRV